MRRRMPKILATAGLAMLALTTATPAHAGYFLTYWSDYVGGTNVGGAYFCNGGNLLYSWGVLQGIEFYQADPSGPC